MGLFDGWFGRKNPWDRFASLDAEDVPPALKALLERVVLVTKVEKPVYATRLTDGRAELRGTLRTFPFRMVITFSGDVSELEMKYADDDLAYLDLEHDPELANKPSTIRPPGLEPWDAGRKLILGGGVFVDGSGAEKEAKLFRALPQLLQERILRVMAHHRVRYFRSRRDEISASFHDEVAAMPDPVVRLRDVLQLCADVSEARGARPPGGKREFRSVSEEAAPLALAEPEVEGWARAKKLAASIERKLDGARVVERADDEAIDIRFTEGSVPVRVVIDAKFGDLDASARAEEVEAELVLERDPDLEIEEVRVEDEWDTPGDRHLFVSRSVHVCGSDLEIRRQAAVLRALGPHTLDELVETIERLELAHVSLSEGILSTTIGDLEDVRDGGRAGIDVARLLGRVASALPRGAAPAAITDKPTSCPRCRALRWSPDRCARCDT